MRNGVLYGLSISGAVFLSDVFVIPAARYANTVNDEFIPSIIYYNFDITTYI